MKNAPSALVSCALVLALSGAAANAERPGATEWLFGSPTGAAQTPDRPTGAVNPLTGDDAPRAQTPDDLPIEQVDMTIAPFGLVSAPIGIGTFEDAYGRIALRSPGSGAQLTPVSASETARRSADLSNKALGIEFDKETPYQVRWIAHILLQHASREQAATYRAWLGSMSADEQQKLIETLHAPMKDVDRVVPRAARPNADPAQNDAYRLAMIQLRNHEYLTREREERPSTTSLLDGISPVAKGSANRDAQAIREVMLGERGARAQSE